MIVGTGIDIVEIPRMAEAIRKWDIHFLKKIFTDREVAYSRSRRFAPQHFAARFAAKEAVIKAFGEPNTHPIRLTDIEVLNDGEGKPEVTCHETARAARDAKGVDRILVSLSHSRQYAVANAVLVCAQRLDGHDA